MGCKVVGERLLRQSWLATLKAFLPPKAFLPSLQPQFKLNKLYFETSKHAGFNRFIFCVIYLQHINVLKQPNANDKMLLSTCHHLVPEHLLHNVHDDDRVLPTGRPRERHLLQALHGVPGEGEGAAGPRGPDDEDQRVHQDRQKQEGVVESAADDDFDVE